VEYRECIEAKRWKAPAHGFEPKNLHEALFDWQKAIVRWCCKKGRSAIFADCGLGKSFMQLSWAREVCGHTHGNVLILAPLAVAAQTKAEGERWGIPVTICKDAADVRVGINITNYERLERFLDHQWSGIVLDESSIIKSVDGQTRERVIEGFASVPYKLACTATPAPNDHTELGNHAEFLGVMSRTEMLASFFVHDGGETAIWRLKGHAQADFWRWVAGWAIMVRKPSDIGFSDAGFELPPLNIIEHHIESKHVQDGYIFSMPAIGLNEQRAARRLTMDERVEAASCLANSNAEQWLIWCEMNDEGITLADSIDDSVEVAGRHNDEEKADRMMGFTEGRYRCLISKSKIAGFGMNWQHCHNMVFVGLSHSYEQFYQSVRRCWRFGQKVPVNIHIIGTDLDSEVVSNIKRKQADADAMAEGMVKFMSEITKQEIAGTERESDEYRTAIESGGGWEMHLGDCVETIATMPADSVGYSIFSPPFASLYTYSNSPFDMGNCKDHDEFHAQFRYLVDQLLRVTMPGRLLSFHCMNLPTSKERDGYIGITDFRGILIRAFVDAGWIYHSEVCIWKDPVTAMQRTKALGLLHKQIRKDSCMSRQGIPDFLVTMRKPGTNPDRVSHGDDLPVSLWQNYASPVWMDINPSDTLQRTSAREEDDERHICPLQLEVIQRALHLWSKEGDLVLSPFAGIGSEGYMATKMGRRFVGCELKQSYFRQACLNLQAVEHDDKGQTSLFDDLVAK
jgi:hypothetical protein